MRVHSTRYSTNTFAFPASRSSWIFLSSSGLAPVGLGTATDTGRLGGRGDAWSWGDGLGRSAGRRSKVGLGGLGIEVAKGKPAAHRQRDQNGKGDHHGRSVAGKRVSVRKAERLIDVEGLHFLDFVDDFLADALSDVGAPLRPAFAIEQAQGDGAGMQVRVDRCFLVTFRLGERAVPQRLVEVALAVLERRLLEEAVGGIVRVRLGNLGRAGAQWDDVYLHGGLRGRCVRFRHVHRL